MKKFQIKIKIHIGFFSSFNDKQRQAEMSWRGRLFLIIIVLGFYLVYYKGVLLEKNGFLLMRVRLARMKNG